MNDENKIIQGLWIGKSLSLMEQLSINSFLSNGHCYHLYTYAPVKAVPKGVIIKAASQILPVSSVFTYSKGFGAGSYAGFADLFRYKLLAERGGYWADLDIVCLKKFDFKEPFVFSSEYGANDETVYNLGVIKVPIGSDWAKDCYKEAATKNFNNLNFGDIGPKFAAAMIKKHNLDKYVHSPAVFCPIKGSNFNRIVDPDFHFKFNNENYAIHLWHEMWRMESSKRRSLLQRLFGRVRVDKNKYYRNNTLYGQLQELYLFS